MGKSEQLVHQGTGSVRSATSTFFRDRCLSLLWTIRREFHFKCLFILIFAFVVLVSAIFCVVPIHSKHSGFDANDAIKLSATVQACFVLEKPVSTLIPHIDRLEYDILNEIGVHDSKVAVLSMHEGVSSNMTTTVVFGFLSDRLGFPISPVYLSVLRSSLIELFLQQSNLTLTTMFGRTSLFEILKFPLGITVIPEKYVPFRATFPQILFNFTLNNSIHEIHEHLADLKKQLKLGLRLRPYENVDVQITNINGSTIDSPVIVQASVKSDLGSLPPERLKELAHTITGSPRTKNLGLNNTVFGKVKEISLSSFLNHSIHATPPGPSPAPSPGQIFYDGAAPNPPPFAKSHSPAHSNAHSPVHSPHFKPHLPSCLKNCAPSPMLVPHPHSPSSSSPSFPPSPSAPSPSSPPFRSAPSPSSPPFQSAPSPSSPPSLSAPSPSSPPSLSASSPSSPPSLSAPSPSSAPSLSTPPPSPSSAPSLSTPAPSPIHEYHQPDPHCQFTIPPPKPAKVFHAVSPAPSVSQPSHIQAPAPAGPASRLSPTLSPLPAVVSSSMSPKQVNYPERPTAPVFSPSYSPLPSCGSPYYMEIWRLLSVCGFLMFHLLCWSNK